jgi:superfamily II DNA/RNA helicase
MSTFAALGLIEPLCLTLAALGYETPTPVQIGAIPGALAGRDVLAAAQTGTGKTAAFVLPLIQHLHASAVATPSNAVRVLVLVPTRELAEQVCESCRDYGAALNVESFAAYGGVSINPQMMRLRRGVDVLVATPGRLLDLHRRNALTFRHVEALVFDEADRMLDLGFSEEITHILSALSRKPQMLLFSATFSDTILALAARLLDKPVQVEASPPNRAAQQVEQWLIPCDKKSKPALFMHLFKAHAWPQVLVFVKTRQGADELASLLQGQAVAAEAIHGDRTQSSRLAALESFKRGEAKVLVATDVAARGLDIELLPQVVNYDLPIVAEDYIHRIGRTGRAGASGTAISLVCADEVQQLAGIETLLGQTLRREEIPGFEAQHRVPQTVPGGMVVKKPKKPKSKKEQRKALLLQAQPGKATAGAPTRAKPQGPRKQGKA